MVIIMFLKFVGTVSHISQCSVAHLMLLFYYRAMHFSAKRSIAIACRLSVCL